MPYDQWKNCLTAVMRGPRASSMHAQHTGNFGALLMSPLERDRYSWKMLNPKNSILVAFVPTKIVCA